MLAHNSGLNFTDRQKWTVRRRITRGDGAGGAMWLPLPPRLGGDARRCRWYRHGQCMRYVAGESHAANSYLCAQKSRAATTLSVLNVVPSCLAWWSRIPARWSRLARTTQLACGSLHTHTTATFWPDNLALNANPRKLSQAQSTPFRDADFSLKSGCWRFNLRGRPVVHSLSLSIRRLSLRSELSTRRSEWSSRTLDANVVVVVGA